ncbi:MAG: DMT family transporter [Deltaproteobacteria bacterium]|nr:DMT family transporter [Deltaproteobacteria bacterium]
MKIFKNGIISMLASSFFFAVMGALVKFSLKEIPLYEVIFFRSIISALILAAIIFHRRESLLGHRRWLLVGRGLAGFSAISCNFYSMKHIPLGDASILNQTSPLFVAFLSVLFLKEKLSHKAILLSIVSLIGVALIVKPSVSHLNFAALIGLLSGLMAACAYVAIRELHATESFLTMAFYFTATTSVLSLPMVLSDFVLPSLNAFLILVGVGITGTLGQMLMTYAYKYEQASWVAPFSYTSVIFSILFGYFLFSEQFDVLSIFGTLLIILSCILLSRRKDPQFIEE